jgi:DNA repair protein REV1
VDPKRLRLPSRPEKPTFTSKKLSSLPELRDALAEWYTEFETDGPYEEDVDALVKYLRRVVLEEKDIAKAVSVAGWLTWLIENNGEDDISGRDQSSTGKNTSSETAGKSLEAWWGALQNIRHGISDAVVTRGLPPVEFT